MESHYDIKLEKYCGILNIEVETMLEMINKDIIPCAFKYMREVANTIADIKNAIPLAKCATETALLEKLSELTDTLANKSEELSKKHSAAKQLKDNMKISMEYVQKVIPAMAEARAIADEIEPLLGEDFKPYPSYEDLLFSV